jgi:hypothetical protein
MHTSGGERLEAPLFFLPGQRSRDASSLVRVSSGVWNFLLRRVHGFLSHPFSGYRLRITIDRQQGAQGVHWLKGGPLTGSGMVASGSTVAAGPETRPGSIAFKTLII